MEGHHRGGKSERKVTHTYHIIRNVPPRTPLVRARTTANALLTQKSCLLPPLLLLASHFGRSRFWALRKREETNASTGRFQVACDGIPDWDDASCRVNHICRKWGMVKYFAIIIIIVMIQAIVLSLFLVLGGSELDEFMTGLSISPLVTI